MFGFCPLGVDVTIKMRYVARKIANDDSGRWNTFVASHPLGCGFATTFAQKWWQATGWSLHLIGLFEKESVVGGVAIRAKKIPYVPYVLARVVTLLLSDDDIAEKTRLLLHAVVQFARSQKALQIEVGSGILDGFALNGIDYTGQVQEELHVSGYTQSNERRGTYLVRIDLDDEALLKSFSSNSRHKVRKAQREGVIVSELRSLEDLDLFAKSYQQMFSRKGLRNLRQVLDTAYEGLHPLYEHGYVRLFAAQYKGRICNMVLVDTLGIPRYWRGATTAHVFENRVPPTGQILHYSIMQWFRDRGTQYYDLGGSPGPTPVKGHPNYTVWRFKHGFRGTYVYCIPFYRYYPNATGKVFTSVARWAGIKF